MRNRVLTVKRCATLTMDVTKLAYMCTLRLFEVQQALHDAPFRTEARRKLARSR